ncbi:MAG: LuxR C-terminal-related transcriptional regulator [Gemmatimonadetes bacterium]|nr:LuxR C-terminal-related transcriptional regulator [Candidatus Palauibacter rhopaloidicola]
MPGANSPRSALLDNSRFAVVQLDRRGRIVAANDRARDLLGQDDGLCDVDGFLSATGTGDNRSLQQLLARAAPALGAPGSSGSITITRSSASTRLVVHTVPLPARERESGARQVGVLVLVADPERRPRIDVGLVQAALGLTLAESQLATLVAEGQRVRDIAARTGRSEGTVRWHLNRIFRKQGISCQADLMRRVLSLDGFPGYQPRQPPAT